MFTKDDKVCNKILRDERSKRNLILCNESIISKIESNFSREELDLIQDEISIIKEHEYLNMQAHIGGNMLGDMHENNVSFSKILTLSRYIDEIVVILQNQNLRTT